MVDIYVAVTDWDWFDLLRAQRGLTEVNFWQPGARGFGALQPGELFLFKLHAPRNYIVGGGVYWYTTILPVSLAWEAFDFANGALSLELMKQRVMRYRKDVKDSREDFQIGCRILEQPFFFDEDAWIPAPASWAREIVTGKRFDTDEAEGRQLWEDVHSRLSPDAGRGLYERPARYGEPTLIRPRLGQGLFRVAVTDAYSRRCAVTRERTLPVLEAVHIKPFAAGGDHEVANGLLLRRDLHVLFDRGYVTVTPDYRFEVSRRIREEFENGRDYYVLHGQNVEVPRKAELRPALEKLEWHNLEIFLG
jgi:putative restriction endonuclease